MKALVVLTLALLTNVAVAAGPVKVGTSVDYNAKVEQGGQTNAGTMNLTVLSHNAVEKKYNVRGTVVFAGATQQSDNWMEANSVENGGIILANCDKAGGTAEEITVPAGKYNTCHIVQNDPAKGYVGAFWVADVPFMIVKSVEVQNGETVSLELTAIK